MKIKNYARFSFISLTVSAIALALNAYAVEAKSGSTVGQISPAKNAVAITDEYSDKKVRIASEEINALTDDGEYAARINQLISENAGNKGYNGGDRFVKAVLASLKSLNPGRFNNAAESNPQIKNYLGK